MERNNRVLRQKRRKSALAGVACGPIQMCDPAFTSLGYSHGDIGALTDVGVIKVTP